MAIKTVNHAQGIHVYQTSKVFICSTCISDLYTCT